MSQTRKISETHKKEAVWGTGRKMSGETRSHIQGQLWYQLQWRPQASTSQTTLGLYVLTCKMETTLPALITSQVLKEIRWNTEHTGNDVHEDRSLIEECQTKAMNGTLQAQSSKRKYKYSHILQSYNLEEEMVIRIVTNNQVQKRRETSSALS